MNSMTAIREVVVERLNKMYHKMLMSNVSEMEILRLAAVLEDSISKERLINERKCRHMELIDDRKEACETILKYTGKSLIKKKVSTDLKYWQQAKQEYDEIYEKLSDIVIK